jgi:hypothetical protein
LYGDRWTIETAFQHLTVDLACEVDTLGYPKAALFGFCVALVAYNVVALVKGALRAAHGAEYVEEQLSMYYLTLEVAQVATGMEIALRADVWEIFRQLSRRSLRPPSWRLRSGSTQRNTPNTNAALKNHHPIN